MIKNIFTSVFNIISLLAFSQVNAQEKIVNEGYYICKTESIYTTDNLKYTDKELINRSIEQGYNDSLLEIKIMQKAVMDNLSEQAIDKEFVVDIKNGILRGFLDNNRNSKPFVLSYGSDSGSYKSLSHSSYSVYSLIIEQYSINERKPFIYSINSLVIMGFCKLK